MKKKFEQLEIRKKTIDLSGFEAENVIVLEARFGAPTEARVGAEPHRGLLRALACLQAHAADEGSVLQVEGAVPVAGLQEAEPRLFFSFSVCPN